MDSIRLAQDPVYLTTARPLSGRREGEFTVQLRASLSAVLAEWQPSTRVSPTWPIAAYADNDFQIPQSDEPLTGFLLFLGPARAYELLNDVLLASARRTQLKHVCLTLGLFNVVAFLTPATPVGQIIAKAEAANSNWELWTLERGQITNTSHSNFRRLTRAWAPRLNELAAKGPWAPPLQGAMEEYLPLLASAVSRSEAALPTVTQHLVDSLLVVSHCVDGGDTTAFEKQSLLTHLNAALSRLTSQMFSGTSPILATECHFWIHSLLGTGTANLGLQKLTDFIQAKMGGYMLPSRLEQLVRKQTPPLVDFHDVSSTDANALRHYLDEIDISVPTEYAIPLISYFSGRDGFKSNTTIISVPLSTISNANATPWTLQTITHEISHVVIEAVLSVVLPDKTREQSMSRAVALIKPPVEPRNWLESLMSHLIRGFLILDRDQGGDERKTIDEDVVSRLISRWIREVSEILVHVFDFMYFYGSDHQGYVKGIWTSWGAIPQISDRIPEYVIRTTCALASKHLTREQPEVNALNQVRQVLNDLEGSERIEYAAEAVRHIDQHRDQIERAVVARLSFIQFVRSFLYSPTLAGQLLTDALSVGGESRSGGYHIRRNELAEQWIANPLKFVSSFTRDQLPSAVASLILWQTLAYGCDPNATTLSA